MYILTQKGPGAFGADTSSRTNIFHTKGEIRMKIYHGKIITVNKNNDVFDYLVEDKGRIVFVGNELPEKFAGAETVELGDRALIPSFADTHQHMASFSAFHAASALRYL